MFTQKALRALLNAKPFMPFRLWLSDGGHVDVRSREVVSPGRYYSIVWLHDPQSGDEGFDHHTTIWHMHITRCEALKAGESPLQPPSEPPSETPAPV